MRIIRDIASPNFGERPEGQRPECIILHFTVIEGTDEVCAFLCDPEREVSAHYVIGEDGEIVRLVAEEMRAWHAGRSFWAGASDLNSRSIGIEIVNNGGRPFAQAQYEALIPLIKEIRARWDIPAQAVLGHSDVAIGRKFDPGPWFDWARLDQEGVTAPPCANIKAINSESDANLNESDFRALATLAGYDSEADLASLLLAIRLRHADVPLYGPLSLADFALIRPR